MAKTLEEANAALLALEGPKHRHALAAHGLATLMNTPPHTDQRMADVHTLMMDEAEIEHGMAEKAYNEHIAVHGGERALSRKVDAAAQEVIDARKADAPEAT